MVKIFCGLNLGAEAVARKIKKPQYSIVFIVYHTSMTQEAALVFAGTKLNASINSAHFYMRQLQAVGLFPQDQFSHNAQNLDKVARMWPLLQISASISSA